MLYLSLVKGAENQGEPPQALMEAMGKLIAESLADGSLVQTGGLAGSAAMIRVRSSGGKIRVTDGPYAEAKEMIGGYAIMKFDTHEEALESTRKFIKLHTDHWPEWEGECELREISFVAP